MIRELLKIFKVIGGKFRYTILLIMRSPFDILMTLINANFLYLSFDAIEQGNIAKLNIACVIFITAILLLFAYNCIVWRIYSKFNIILESRLRSSIFNKISKLPLLTIESKSQGDWITRLNTDVALPLGRPMNLPHAACAIVNITISAIFLIRINISIFLLLMLFVIPHILITQVFISRRMPHLTKRYLEQKGNNTSDLNNIITNAETAAIYDAKDYFISRFRSSSLRMRKANMRIISLKALSASLINILGKGGYFLLLIICGKWIVDGLMTFGELTAAFQYRGGVLVGTIMLIYSLISISGSKASLIRVNEIINLKADV